MTRSMSVVGVVLVFLLAVGFGAINVGNRATVDLGFMLLRRVPVAFIAFAGMIAGMTAILIAGMHTDRRVREILREAARGALPGREGSPSLDEGQSELFDPTPWINREIPSAEPHSEEVRGESGET